jgi:hypothetical protein
MSCGVPGHLMREVPMVGDYSKIILDKASYALIVACPYV